MLHISVDIGGTLDVFVDQFGIQFQGRFLVRTCMEGFLPLWAGLFAHQIRHLMAKDLLCHPCGRQ
jgi:hypothetical protein